MFNDPLDPANEPEPIAVETMKGSHVSNMTPHFSQATASSLSNSVQSHTGGSQDGSLGATSYCSLTEYITSQRVREHGAEYPTLGVFTPVTFASSMETDKSLDINQLVKQPQKHYLL